SSGAATVAAIVSGLAPGSEAATEIVGKSTCGKGDTGKRVNATAPEMITPRVRRVVATGRRMNGRDRFMRRSAVTGWHRRPVSYADGATGPACRSPGRSPVS